MEAVLKEAERLGAEFADVRYYRAETLTISSSEARDVITNYGVSEGYALRALVDGGWGYYSGTELGAEAARIAVSSSPRTGRARVRLLQPKRDRVLVRERSPLAKTPAEVLQDVRKLRESVLASDSRIRSVTATYSYVHYNKAYLSTDGRDIQLEYSVHRLAITAVAREGDITASAYHGVATYLGYPLDVFDVNELVGVLLRRLRNQLVGVHPKPGEYPVVLSPEVSGVFAHEALGHLAEADLAVDGILSRLRGKRIAAEFVNVSDSPSVDHPMAVGILPYDDEGVEGREVRIIENGIVREFMTDRSYSAALGVEPTGNGRAEDFRSSVLIRMRNTFFKPGDMTLDELLEGVKEGFLMLSVMGGQTSPDGTFQFGIQEGYHVVNGEPREPLRTTGIAGYTIETIANIDGVSRDLDFRPGVCGKSGQSVFVGTGGPYVRVSRLKVG